MTIDKSKIRKCATPDLVSAWHHLDEQYRDILDNIPSTPGWYADKLLEDRDFIAKELARRKRERLALVVDFTSRISETDIEYVKALTDIVDLISESTKLRKVKDGKYRGTCPLHDGDNPTSLSVDATKGVWHCHSVCQAGGDAYTWIEKRDKVSFPEAVRKLADRAGVELTTPENDSSVSDSNGRTFVKAAKPRRPETIVLV